MQSPLCCPHCEDLEKQITGLKLKIFWKNHNRSQLQFAMKNANQDVNGPDCVCLACAVSGRKDEEKEAKGFDCTFKPYFEALLTEFGLTVGCCDGEPAGVAHDSDDFIYNNDTHFVHVGAREDWFCFAYGAKLWSATASDDPELQKLVHLFERLQPDEEE